MCPSCRTAAPPRGARCCSKCCPKCCKRTAWLRRLPAAVVRRRAGAKRDAFLSSQACTTACRCSGRSMSGCLVMHKTMTPLAGAVNWSSSAMAHSAWRHCATRQLRQTGKHMQAGRQPFMLGCPLLMTTAQTRIVLGGACMHAWSDDLFRAVHHLDEVQTFSRCRGRRFEK